MKLFINYAFILFPNFFMLHKKSSRSTIKKFIFVTFSPFATKWVFQCSCKYQVGFSLIFIEFFLLSAWMQLSYFFIKEGFCDFCFINSVSAAGVDGYERKSFHAKNKLVGKVVELNSETSWELKFVGYSMQMGELINFASAAAASLFRRHCDLLARSAPKLKSGK